MSPSWRDLLAIALRPDEVRVQRHRRGWQRRADPPVTMAVAPGGDMTAACLQALEQALPAAAQRAFDVRLVLSDHLVRYAVVHGVSGLRDQGEREAAARHAMAAVYGDRAERWRVVLDGAAAADDALAAAIDEDLCAELMAQLRAAGARRLHIEPLFAFALNRCARSLTPRTGWVAVAERGRVTLASLANGRLGSLRSHRLRGALQAQLPVLLEQGSLLENADAQRSDVVLATEDEAAPPGDGQPFRFQTLRLDLTALAGLGGAAT